jgi:hypothetical protein
MVAIGQLLSTLTLRVICSDVAANTTVDYYLLLEDEEFLKQASRADSFQELYDWVEENY